MLPFILHLLNVLASQSVSAPVASVSVVPPNDKTPAPASTSSSSVLSEATFSSKDICVKCYNKLITPDCTNTCRCECGDGDGNGRIISNVVSKPSQCPNVDPSEVPCPCKDENNNIIPGNSYVKGLGVVNNIGN